MPKTEAQEQPALMPEETHLLDIPAKVGRTEVQQIEAQSILGPGVGFMDAYDWRLNPYAGCSFGCQYCYASAFVADMARRTRWGQWVDAKANAAALIAEKPGSLNGKTLYMANATDPYQPLEREAMITRKIMEALVQHHPKVKLVIQTRGTLVTRDIDLMKELEEAGGRVQVNMTITTDSDEVRKAYEPGCPSIQARTRATRTLAAAGIQTCVTMTPALPMEDPSAFAHSLVADGTRRFIIQAFHPMDQGRQQMIAVTDRKAIDSAKAHFQVKSDGEAIRAYNVGYIKDFREIRDALAQYDDVVLGQNKEGFAPPF